jgi:Pyruvate/2-oxoacid:ferredoxin oxidoreductase delta subunit
MTAAGDIFRRLQQHLDRQAVGFPATAPGVELRLLEHCFTPRQAEIALLLTYRLETVDEILARAGASDLSRDELATALREMAYRGVIGRRLGAGADRYKSWPLTIGFWEGQVDRLTPQLVADFEEYISDLTFGAAFVSTARPQMRTIPLEGAADPRELADYDRLEALVEGVEGPIVVTECICRRSAEIQGRPCGRTALLETCLAFRDLAETCLETDTGRQVDRDETLALLRRNQAEGLVLQPANAVEPEFICSCCGCCCGILDVARRVARPTDFWATNFHAENDPGSCAGCETCVECCPVAAIKLYEGRDAASVIDACCIGCGVCVVKCPERALSLERNVDQILPPATVDDLYDEIMARKPVR